jgi:hypothetical protein
MEKYLVEFLKDVALASLPLISAFVVKYLTTASNKLKTETSYIKDVATKNLVNETIDDVNKLVVDEVNKTKITTKAEILKVNGTITKEQGVELLKETRDRIVGQLTSDVIELLKKKIVDVEAYVETQIEVAIAKTKGQIK